MRSRRIKLEYDPEVDAAYLTLAGGKVVESEEVQPGVILDFDADDQVLGVEILRFTRRFLPSPPASANGRRTRRPRPSTAAGMARRARRSKPARSTR
jgi:uncharacterized protein YuzE